jgi:type I restriction enzyme S subunit
VSFPRYPEYKDSGVEWLGQVPAHWGVPRLRFTAQLNPSKNEVRQLPAETVVSFLPMEAIGEDGSIDLSRERILADVTEGYTFIRDGDVAFAKITPCFENGKGAVMRGLQNGIGFGTTELIVVRPEEQKLSPYFLHYLFTSTLFRQAGESLMYGAGGQKRVPDSFVRDAVIPLPSPEEQAMIGAFLDREIAKIDTLVAEQERLIALLKEKRQAVISHTVTKGLNPDAPTKDSGIDWLGSVPAGWTLTPLRYLVQSVGQGWSPQCESYAADWESEYGVLKVGAVNGGIFDPSENKKLPPALEPQTDLAIRAGDLMISRANTRELVGSAAVADDDYPHLLLCDKLYRLRFRRSGQLPKFISRFLATPVIREQIELGASGASASMLNISQSVILDLPAPVPPEDEMLTILDYCARAAEETSELIEQAEGSVSLLIERRAALITAAVTGQIDVRDLAPSDAA